MHTTHDVNPSYLSSQKEVRETFQTFLSETELLSDPDYNHEKKKLEYEEFNFHLK
jgi:hypothetical protein